MKPDNTRVGKLVDVDEQWRRFDRMPAEIRRIYAFAPYDFAVPPKTPKKPNLIQQIFATRDKEIARTYGKDHPQYKSRVPGRLKASPSGELK